MVLRFPSLRIAGAALFLCIGAPLGVPAVAQEPGNGPEWAQPPTDLPTVNRKDPAYNLDTLFAALKIAPDEATAKAIESRIWAVWMVSGSDTCTLLMDRVKVAIEAKNYDLALKLLDAVIEIKPSYVEAWNQRATIYYLKDD